MKMNNVLSVRSVEENLLVT